MVTTVAAPAGPGLTFDELYKRYSGRIAAYFRGQGLKHADAEDKTQEVFLTYWQSDSVIENPLAYLYGIAHHLLRQSLPEEGEPEPQMVSLDVDRHGNIADGRNSLEKVENRTALEEALAGLSELERSVVVWHHYQGYTREEIARRLGLSEVVVQDLENNALKKLHGMFVS